MSSPVGEPHFHDVRVDRLADAQVTIVGLGLTGGSLAGVARRARGGLA